MEILFLVYCAIGFVIVVAIDSQGAKQKGEQEPFFRLFLPTLLWPMFVLAGLGMWLGDRFLAKKKPSESLSASKGSGALDTAGNTTPADSIAAENIQRKPDEA